MEYPYTVILWTYCLVFKHVRVILQSFMLPWMIYTCRRKYLIVSYSMIFLPTKNNHSPNKSLEMPICVSIAS